MRTKNGVTMLVSQHIPAYVTSKGSPVEEFNNEHEFTSETVQELTAEQAALWAVCALKKYQKMQRLQRKTGFKMSKDVSIKFSVNNRSESVSMKFSLNVDRLNGLLDRTPELFAEAFTMNPSIGGLNKTKALNYINTLPSKVILAGKVLNEIENADVLSTTLHTETNEIPTME